LGYKDLAVAEDGTRAYRKLVDGNFDLVISDWNMPKMTGIQLLKAIRRNEIIKNLPVLLITSEGQKKQVMEAAKAGVNSLLLNLFMGLN
jgi:two-component system chemotaxis response regulator CheY